MSVLGEPHWISTADPFTGWSFLERMDRVKLADNGEPSGHEMGHLLVFVTDVAKSFAEQPESFLVDNSFH